MATLIRTRIVAGKGSILVGGTKLGEPESTEKKGDLISTVRL